MGEYPHKGGNQIPTQNIINELISTYKEGQLALVVDQGLSLTEQYPNAFIIWNIVGAAAARIGNLDLAINAFQKVINIKPDYAEAYNNLGNPLTGQGKLDEAIAYYQKALSLKPDYSEAYNNMGIALHYQGKFIEAISSYQKALSLKPNYSEAYYNIGNAYKGQGRLDEAIASYQKALSLKPDHAEVSYNMGKVFQDQDKLSEAISSYQKALSLKPDHAEAYNNMGTVLQIQGKLDDAITCYQKALLIKPDYADAKSQYLHQMAHICDWSWANEAFDGLEKLGVEGDSVAPFTTLAMQDAPDRHRLRSINYTKNNYPQIKTPTPFKPSGKLDRLNIGYFSADFHNHATMYLMGKIFELHNKNRFQIFAFSYGPDSQDTLRKKLMTAVDVFHDVRRMNDLQMVELARAEKLDIAIDLKGFTQNSRLAPFSYGLAPVQISYLGYPGTLGADFIDYIIADPVLIPENKRQYYSENVIYLPNTYQPTDNTRKISDKAIIRSEMGLPDNGFIFCCFNNNYKISPKEFDIWMRLLAKVKGSVLWLLKSNKWAEQNLQKEAEIRGISADRLVFADRVPQAEHLARQSLADLFIDTFNCNAHTTASDALWAGLPLVTKLGESFAARVAGSLLNAIGLPELITESEDSYEALILDLATNPRKLFKIKKKLSENRLTMPLFNTEKYTRHLENGYQQAYQRYFDGLKPDTIIVS
ncbi:tetratricopeptide repeat protein, partial [Rhodobacteraceae bacterium]|nr:tetratricopeptide repeat protein [Paracoccaceae bacterium]